MININMGFDKNGDCTYYQSSEKLDKDIVKYSYYSKELEFINSYKKQDESSKLRVTVKDKSELELENTNSTPVLINEDLLCEIIEDYKNIILV